MPSIFEARSSLPVSAESAFAWHCAAGALNRLIPPWEDVLVEGDAVALERGQRMCLRPKVGLFRLRWLAHIERLEPSEYLFQDTQISGPFASWEHRHRMIAEGPHCVLEDRVSYRAPFGFLGRAAGFVVRSRLKSMFEWRHAVTLCDLRRHSRQQPQSPMKILVTGASGMVGSSLIPFLTTGGHQVVTLVRREPKNANEVQWSVEGGVKNPEALEGLDGVFHLAGENIASGRWNDAQKERIMGSRVDGTRVVVDALLGLKEKPKVFISASAIGFYGNRGDEVLDETASRGTDYLSDVVVAWEEQTKRLEEAGVRTVLARIGVVLSPRGGALKKMLLPFKMGGGGIVGSGNQWMSWVALDDLIGALHHALMTPDMRGPINITAPGAVTNRSFTKVLGRVLRRPTILPIPAIGVKLAFGEMGEALLLGSQRVQSKALTESGFHFDYPDLEGALRHLLGKRPSSNVEMVHS